MRLTITDDEYKDISNYLKKKDKNNLLKILEDAKDIYEKSITVKKLEAPKKANQAKVENSIAKVENAINLLRMEDKKINANTVAKTAKIDYKTASKYLKLLGG